MSSAKRQSLACLITDVRSFMQISKRILPSTDAFRVPLKQSGGLGSDYLYISAKRPTRSYRKRKCLELELEALPIDSN